MPRIEPKFVSKDWGYEFWLTNNDKYCGKILFVKKGQHGSLHYHPIKDEVMHVRKGLLHIVIESNEVASGWVIRPGESFHIPPGTRHQLKAIEDTEIIEISTPHSDEDVVRLTREEVRECQIFG